MHITICIPTRNRGARIACTLQSIAASRYDDFDVVIVDQSDNDDTAVAVREATAGDARFSYIRSQTRGVAASLNVGIAHALGPLVATTADDCEVPPEWLSTIVRYFEAHPKMGQLTGEVRPGPCDAATGLIPEYTISHLKWLTSPREQWREGGAGACMIYRLEALHEVGPFDEVLGPGGAMRVSGGEDSDMMYRILRAGYPILLVPDLYVIHHGFRTWDELSTLVRGSGSGIAAAHAKYARLGDYGALPIIVEGIVRSIDWKRLLLLRRPFGLAYARGCAEGIWKSLHYHIDRQRCVYIPEMASAPRTAVSASFGDHGRTA